MKKIKLITFLIAAACSFAAQSASATPDCRQCPYTCADLGLGHKDCSVQSVAGGICCLDLTRKGLEIAAARANVAGSNGYNNGGGYGGGCPAGFHPSSSKCSPDERRNGCKDLRGPSGQTCTNK